MYLKNRKKHPIAKDTIKLLCLKDNIVLPIRGVSKYKEIHDRDIWEIVIFAL